jgi:hypothetical protein
LKGKKEPQNMMRSLILLPTLLLTTLFLTLFASSVHANNAFRILMQPHTRDCFYENLKADEQLDISFQVLDGGNLDIDFWVSSWSG